MYHFAVASDLAWFSSNVHLITLGVLEDYLFENHVQRDWRVTLMVPMALLLAASSVMEGHYRWYDSWPYDAQCLFDELVGNVHGSPMYWMLVQLGLICYSYTSNIIPLFDRPSEFANYWLETKPRAFMDEAVEHLIDMHTTSPKSFIGSIKCRTCKLLNLVIRVVKLIHFVPKTLIGSKIIAFAIDIYWFAYGLWGILGDRNIASSDMIGDENAMTFGQIMPVLLLSSLVLVFREAYDGTYQNTNPRSERAKRI